jgi:hypothetical protein
MQIASDTRAERASDAVAELARCAISRQGAGTSSTFTGVNVGSLGGVALGGVTVSGVTPGGAASALDAVNRSENIEARIRREVLQAACLVRSGPRAVSRGLDATGAIR